MRKQHDVKDEVNRMLANEISNLRLHLEDSRKHHLGRTSEQRSLLNNRNIDKFAMNNPNMTVLTRRTVITIPNGNETSSDTSSNGSQSVQNNKSSRKKRLHHVPRRPN